MMFDCAKMRGGCDLFADDGFGDPGFIFSFAAPDTIRLLTSLRGQMFLPGPGN
jgi:hypothetical protein